MRDLRAGITETSTNKVLKRIGKEQYLVKSFGCQLAEHVDDTNGIRPGVYKADKVYIEMKLNGVRLLSIVYPEKKHCIQLSRNGKEMQNFDSIRSTLAGFADQFGWTEPMVIDGEVMSKTFQKLMTQVHRKKDVNTVDCVYHVFDIVPLADFVKGQSTLKMSERLLIKDNFAEKIKGFGVACVRALTTHTVDLTTTDAIEQVESLRTRAIEAGFEGLVFKNPNSYYRSTGLDSTDRNDGWIAYKPTITVTLTIKDFYEGTGKYVGMLGGIVCEGHDLGKDILVDCGGGFSDEQRMEMWAARSTLAGQLVEVKGDELTLSKDSDKWSVRFPRFQGFRSLGGSDKV